MYMICNLLFVFQSWLALKLEEVSDVELYPLAAHSVLCSIHRPARPVI